MFSVGKKQNRKIFSHRIHNKSSILLHWAETRSFPFPHTVIFKRFGLKIVGKKGKFKINRPWQRCGKRPQFQPHFIERSSPFIMFTKWGLSGLALMLVVTILPEQSAIMKVVYCRSNNNSCPRRVSNLHTCIRLWCLCLKQYRLKIYCWLVRLTFLFVLPKVCCSSK